MTEILDEMYTSGKETTIFVNHHWRQLQSAHRLRRFTNLGSTAYPTSYEGTECADFSEAAGLNLDDDSRTNRVSNHVFPGKEIGMATRALVGIELSLIHI